MGYNSAVLILNDRLHEINKDPVSWWKKIYPVMTSAGHGIERSDVFHVEHMDNCGVYIIGHNHASRLGFCRVDGHHTEEGQVAALKAVAAQHGYRLVKIPQKV